VGATCPRKPTFSCRPVSLHREVYITLQVFISAYKSRTATVRREKANVQILPVANTREIDVMPIGYQPCVRKWTSSILQKTIRDLAAGQKVFGRCVLRRMIGRGGMGVVWLACDEELERDVALKFLPLEVATDEHAIRDLKRETTKSQQLRHHHIVQVYDFIPDNATPAFRWSTSMAQHCHR
jgi:hypothetical protein